MNRAYLHSYLGEVFINNPWKHWLVIGILSLALIAFLLVRKRHSAYGAICLGITVFIGLFLLDTAVLIRWGDGVNRTVGFNLASEYQRLLDGGVHRWTEMLANVAVFVPFGFFLTEFLATTKRFGAWQRIGRVALAAFCLSLCIESLQLVFHLGVFEITDLVLNTVGGVVGASLSLGWRMLWDPNKVGEN